MNIKECYEKIGGDYEGTMNRLMKEERILKYLNKFIVGNDMEMLSSSLEAKDYETAFRCAHNMKGLGLNLGLTKLHQASDILCEQLRGGEPKIDVSDMLLAVRAAYDETIAAVKEIDS